jgi:hypothetical protein
MIWGMDHLGSLGRRSFPHKPRKISGPRGEDVVSGKSGVVKLAAATTSINVKKAAMKDTIKGIICNRSLFVSFMVYMAAFSMELYCEMNSL